MNYEEVIAELKGKVQKLEESVAVLEQKLALVGCDGNEATLEQIADSALSILKEMRGGTDDMN